MAPGEKEMEEVAGEDMKDAKQDTAAGDAPDAVAEGRGEEPVEDGEQASEAAADSADAKGDADGEEDKGEQGGAKDEAEEAMEEEAEAPKEFEEDALEGGQSAIEGVVAMNPYDSTINVMTSCGGKVLMALSDGGFQHLLACGRANVGIKQGRYLYEARIVESRNPLDPTAKQQGRGMSRQICCLGFSVAGSSLFLGDGEESIGFDSDGNFLVGKSRNRICPRFMPYTQVIGVLLNLDQKSPNANTVSLFRDGVRVCQPKPIPESLRGKALYPTVNYKNMTLHLNFGPAILAPLPFKCLTLQQSEPADAELVVPRAPADDRCEVVFPVGLPDEGTFDWLDEFLKGNPEYTELSSRALLEWGLKSGLWRQRGSSRSCNDRPMMEFGIRELDDDTIHQMIQSVTPVLKRNYVVMEVRNNLLAKARQEMLENFDSSDFKKVAVVVMGEPPKEHQARVHQLILQEKRQRAADDVRRKRAQDDQNKRPPAPPSNGRHGEGAENGNDAKAKDGEKDEAGAEDCAKSAPEETLEEAIRKAEDAVELTEEEKGLRFRRPTVEDLTTKDLSQHFSSFTIPLKEEGFEEVRFDWQSADACAEYLKVWISERKLTQRVEDLQPGQWFKEQFDEWSRLLHEWRRKHGEWQDPNRRWYAEKRRRSEKDEKGEHKEREAPEEEKEKEKGPEDGEAKELGKDGEAKEDGKNEEINAKEQDAKMEDVKAEDIDVFEVEDVCDVGNGEPLFANFTWEDWMLLSLRFELHLLAHAYKRDINDPERTSFHESHLGFYYNKYYKKTFNLKYYGVSTELELLQIIKDTIEVAPKNSILDPQLADDTPMDNFVKLTEDHRRERNRLIDAGDETAMLKFQKPPPRGQSGYQQGGSRGGYQSRGPPPAQYTRGGPPNMRTGPPSSGPPSRYGSGSGSNMRSGSGGYSSGSGGGGGYGSRGGPPPSRYGPPAPAPPPSRGYGHPAPQSSSYGGGGQKRSYPPPSSSSYPPYKQARSSSYGSAPPPSRGSYGSSSGYGASGGSYGGGYRR